MTRTNAAGVLTVLVRAVGLWLAAQAALTLPYTLGFDEVAPLKLMLGPPLVLLAVALTLWIFADLLAKLALVRPGQPPFESDLDVGQWQTIAFATVGAVLAGGGLVILVNQVFLKLVFGSADDGAMNTDEFTRGIVFGAVKFAIGAAMMLGASGLVGVVHRLRGYHQASPAGSASVQDVDPRQ